MMIESMFNIQSSTSMEDLTSLSSISSLESTSIYSSNHSSISSCNESRLKKRNKSLPQINCDSENLSISSSSSSSSCSPSPIVAQSSSPSSSLSALINQRLRQKMKMLNIHPDNLTKSYKKVTFNTEHRDGQTVDIVKEIIEKQSISHQLPTHNMETTTGVEKFADNQPTKSNQPLQSMKSHKPNESIPVNPVDISSVSSIEVAPSTIKQFKYMIEKQKSYLDCLQRELNRLQRMEDVLSELNYKSELQKRAVNDLTYNNCDVKCNNCACQLTCNQDEQFQQDTNPKLLEPENEPIEDLSDISTVESVVSSVTLIDQPSDVTSSVVSLQSDQNGSLGSKSRGKIHPIHAKIDQMINKLHEETVTKHSIGVQTTNQEIRWLDEDIEPEISYQPTSSRTIRKSADNNKLTSRRPSIQDTLNKPVAWTIILTKIPPSKQPKTRKTRGQAYYLRENYGETSDLTLQQAFRAKCGRFAARSQARTRQINIAAAIRRATAEIRLERQLEEFLERNQLPRYDFLTGHRSSYKIKIIKPKKIFTEKEMKQQTERLYLDLPEIKKRAEEKRREENVKTHRMMARNFSQQLKSKAVEGKTTFPLTQRLNNN